MKTPAFQFYPQDFLSSPDVQMMTTQEVGAYCLLLFNSWIYSDNPGYLPNNEKKLQRLTKLSPDDWQEVKDIVLEKFTKSECGQFLFNKRLVSEAFKQEQRRQKLAENGSKGGRPKNQSKTKSKANGNQKVSETKPNDNQNESLSSSSSSSISSSPTAKDIKYPFESVLFLKTWDKWKTYKKAQFKFTFKTVESEQAQLNLLRNMSGSNESKAIQIIEYTMGQTWQGLQEPKVYKQSESTIQEDEDFEYADLWGGKNPNYKD